MKYETFIFFEREIGRYDKKNGQAEISGYPDPACIMIGINRDMDSGISLKL
jgi:hypothetical protein